MLWWRGISRHECGEVARAEAATFKGERGQVLEGRSGRADGVRAVAVRAPRLAGGTADGPMHAGVGGGGAEKARWGRIDESGVGRGTWAGGAAGDGSSID